MKDRFYWPELIGDVHDGVKACKDCQIFVEKHKLAPLSFILVFVEEPFRLWGLYFIGEIHPLSSGKHKWILIAAIYFTEWVEVIPSRNTTGTMFITFMEENILSMFGCPMKIVINNAQVFKSMKLINFFQRYNIILGHSTTY